MLRELSIEELRWWIAYNEIEPIGPIRGDYQAAQVTQAILEVHRNRKKRRKPFKIEELRLKFGGEEDEKGRRTQKKEETPYERGMRQKAIGRQWFELYNHMHAEKVKRSGNEHRRT